MIMDNSGPYTSMISVMNAYQNLNPNILAWKTTTATR
jgi:hypothetical protein